MGVVWIARDGANPGVPVALAIVVVALTVAGPNHPTAGGVGLILVGVCVGILGLSAAALAADAVVLLVVFLLVAPPTVAMILAGALFISAGGHAVPPADGLDRPSSRYRW